MNNVNNLVERGQTMAATRMTGRLGSEKAFPHVLTVGAEPLSGRLCYARLMKNVSAGAVTGGLLVIFDADGDFHKEFDAKSSVDIQAHGVVDWTLPSAGCPVDDCCWVFYWGPARLISDGAGALAERDRLMTSGAATGKVKIYTEVPADVTAHSKCIRSYVGTVADATVAAVDGTAFWANLDKPLS